MKLALASGLIEEVRSRAVAEGLAVSIAASDAAGNVVALVRMDGARFLTTDIAIGKAFTAAAFGRPSESMNAALSEFPFFAGVLQSASHGRFAVGPGGLPVFVDGELVGGLAVSGGSPAQDEQLTRQALSALGLPSSADV
jgi:uncharacterized protein GlcG (DUF336 family)